VAQRLLPWSHHEPSFAFEAILYDVGPVGGLIVGSFQATVGVAGVDHTLHAKFAVCQVLGTVAP
jgi:hypothetical protein